MPAFSELAKLLNMFVNFSIRVTLHCSSRKDFSVL